MKIYNHNIHPSIIQKTSFKASENKSVKTDKKNNDSSILTSTKKNLPLLGATTYPLIFLIIAKNKDFNLSWKLPIMAGIGFIVGKLIEPFVNKTDKK